MKKRFERVLSGLLVMAMLAAMPVAAMADGGSTIVNPVTITSTCDHNYASPSTTLELDAKKVEVKAATCTTAGYTKYTCTKCGQVIYDNFQAPTGHTYSKVSTSTDGTTTTYTCVHGDASYTVRVSGGHVHTENGVDTAATKVVSQKTVSPVPGISYVVDEYSCSLENAQGESGKGCGYTQVVYDATASAALHHSYAQHTFGPWKYVEDPTESKPGVAEHTCTVCGFTEKAQTPMQTPAAKSGRVNKDMVNAYDSSTGSTVALLLAKGTTFNYANDLVDGRYRVTNLTDVNRSGAGSTKSGTFYLNPADVEVNPGSIPLTTAYPNLQKIVKVQTDGQVNVRAGVSNTSAVKYTVANGQTLYVYRVENVNGEDWGRVSATANEWIKLDSSYLSMTDAFGFGGEAAALSQADPAPKNLADSGVVVSASTIIVRADRSASGASVGTLPRNTKVNFYYYTESGKEVSPFSKTTDGLGWGRLDADEAKRLGLSGVGYVDMSTIHLDSDPTPIPDASGNKVVATGTVTSTINLRVRSEPKISVLNQIGSLPTGTKVELLEIGDHNGASWGRINYKGKTGWICMTYVQVQQTTTGTSGSTTTNAKENGTVANCSVAVNVRDAAKIQGRLVTTIGVGKRVAITKLENGWGLVDGKGWVYMDYVKLDSGAEDAIKNGTNSGNSASTGSAVKTYTNVSALGQVKVAEMTIYKDAVAKPGTELLKLVNGNTFVITDRTIIDNTIWFKTTIGSVTGWAMGGTFNKGDQEAANVTLPALSGTVSTSTLNVYKTHSLDSERKAVLGANTAVTITAQWTDGVYVWGKLSDGRGWVQMNDLTLNVPESNVVTGSSVGSTPITGKTNAETPVYSTANGTTVLLKLAANRAVTVTDWYQNSTELRGKITDGGVVGWIDMAKVAQNAADATVTEDIVYLYTEAGKLSTRTTLSKRQNEKLSVMTRTLVGSSVWGKISVKDASGVPAYYWINLASTSLGTYSVTPGTGTTTPTTPTTPGNTGNTGNTGTATTTASGTVVNADEVNVRSGAGVANAKVTSLKRGTPVTVHEQKTVDNALWGRIDQGWIAMQYVDLSSKANNGTTTTVPSGTISGNTILTTVPSGAIGVGFVNTANLAVRSGAGQGYAKTGTLKLYTNVVIYEHVLKDGMIWGRCDQGWICTSYITYTGTSVTGSGTAGTIARCFYTANVRSAPGVGNALVGKVMVNSRVEILEQKDYSGETWGRTSLGWVSMQYVLVDGTIPTP